jgi:RNA polymerase sigma factor for flagellar operon FliA
LKEKATVNQLNQLWRKFKQENDQEAHDQLILHYSPLVKYVASRVSANLPKNIELADLISCGMFGLIDAVEKFDLSRQIKFETYAMPRIKGAIIDDLRSQDWLPRSIRHKSKELEKVYLKLETKLHRAPTDEEVAKEMNMTITELQSLLSQLSYKSLVPLDELWNPGGEKDDTVSLIDTLRSDPALDPSNLFEVAETKEILARAIDRLPEREKIVVALYYYENLTLREIGEVLGVTESRVSQLHTKAIIRLKAKLGSSKFQSGASK